MSRLLRSRNIGRYSPKTLYLIGDGPVVSYATIAMLGPGRIPLTPQSVTAFATVLGIAPGDLAAITGVAAARNPRLHRNHAELAQLAWDTRRLTTEQQSEGSRWPDGCNSENSLQLLTITESDDLSAGEADAS